MLSDVLNLLFSFLKNNSHLIFIFLFPVFLGLSTSFIKLVLFPFSCTARRPFLLSSLSSSSSSALPEDADAYVLDSQGVLVPVYSFDRGD